MKRLFAFFLVLCSILTLPSFSIFALGSLDDTDFDISTSDVLEDLSRTYIDGEKFVAEEYPLTPGADYITLLNIVEYAYDDYGAYADVSPYGLFFYVYNPSGDKVLTRGGNFVQISVSERDFYVKYSLTVVSSSDDNRFIKLKINSPISIYKRLWSDIRTYKLSGIELETKSKGIKEFNIAGTYTFTGKQSAKTLSCKTDTLTTLELDIGDTCYRTNTSELGEYHRNQLDSVYFSVPNFILDAYGSEIYKIRFEMTQKRITGIVTSDREAYDGAGVYIQNYISPTSFDDFSSSYSATVGWSFSTHEIGGLFDWTKPYAWNSPAEKRLDYLSFFAYVATYDPNDLTSIDGKELLRYWDKYPLKDESCLEIIPKKEYEVTLEDTFSSLGYDSNHGFLKHWMDFGFWDAIAGDSVDPTLFQDVKPFQALSSSALSGLSNDAISSTYYVQKSDAETIRAYVSNAEASDKTTFLFRFNKQDFFAMPGGMQNERVVGLENVDLDSFYFEEYIFEDFDIMEISFRDESDIITVLPVVMDPTIIVPDIDSPIVDPFGADKNTAELFKKLVGYLALIFVVLLLAWVIMKFIPRRVRVTNGRRRRRR